MIWSNGECTIAGWSLAISPPKNAASTPKRAKVVRIFSSFFVPFRPKAVSLSGKTVSQSVTLQVGSVRSMTTDSIARNTVHHFFRMRTLWEAVLPGSAAAGESTALLGDPASEAAIRRPTPGGRRAGSVMQGCL